MEGQRKTVRPDEQPLSASFHARSRAASLAVVAFVIAVATPGSTAAAQQPGADGPSKALEGRWRLELYLGTPSAHTSPMAGQINGEIAFGNTAWWNPSDRFGRHDLNLQSFFGNSFLRPASVTPFGAGDTSMVTEVSGSVRRDSVAIDFMPRIDHGGITMSGRFWGDSAMGTWHRRGTDGDGRFVLRRLSKDPVTVAAIPDGRSAPVAVAAAAPSRPPTKAQLRAQTRLDAAIKAKADADAVAIAQAQSEEKAKAAALAKVQARDSAKAQVVAAARAKAQASDSAKAQVVAAARAKAQAKDSARAQAVAAAQAKKDARVQALASARATKDSSAQATRVAIAARKSPPTQTATLAANLSSGGAAGTVRPPPGAAAAAPNGAPDARPAVEPAAAASTSTPGTAGSLRVRIFDEAAKKYFVTTYSLHLPDGHWLYGKLRTGNGPDGYGPPVPRPPGNYEIEIANFMCGDKLWFLKDKILKPVVIEQGAPADVTIDVNLAAVPARPSIDNKTGASCSAAPLGAP